MSLSSSILVLTIIVAVAQAADYGVDCSFPIHSKQLKCGDLLGNRTKFYEDFMDGCRKFHGSKGKRCDITEEDRIAMSIRQPQSMVNYTSTGFKKIKAPEKLWNLIKGHWDRNKDQKAQEVWPQGSIYVNNWVSPTYMVSVEDQNLRGTGGMRLKNQIWDAARDTIEEWTGMEVEPTSMYGIRIYTEGAVLNPHVDRLPLVSSCIINVAQDLDEDWPLEVYDRHDRAVNVSMAPGDMVLYESGSLMHGRPFPLKGRYYANIFIHFQPIRPLNKNTGTVRGSPKEEDDDFYPPYLVPGSPEIDNWAEQNPYGWKKPSPSASHVDTPEGHYAAQIGDIEALQRLQEKNRKALHLADRNGWKPIHEAARAGHIDAVKLLVEYGAEKNARTHGGKGHSPLAIAIESLSENHPVVEYLKSVGALNIGPEL